MPLSIVAAHVLLATLGTTWVYWGVPRRAVAIWAIAGGAGLAALNLLVWLVVAGGFGISPTWRMIGGIAFSAGISMGGLVSYFLHHFGLPAGRIGA